MPPSTHESMSFRPPPPNWRSRWVLKPILAGIGIFILACFTFISPEIYYRLHYEWGHRQGAPALSSSAQVPVAAAGPAAVSAAPELAIPKINVVAPVVFESSLKNADILGALQSGVIHYANTAMPGQAGNAVIFGHSSEDWWQPGGYKFIFVLLDKLTVGDRVSVDYQSQKYSYVVTGSRVVEATDFSVLSPTATPTLTLITCSPVGTSLRRLVVTARQVDPAPSAPATAAVPATVPQASAPGQALVGSTGVATVFWNVISAAWNSVFHPR
jgi:LPXTG-site transpeptidase (sortase) family protein